MENQSTTKNDGKILSILGLVFALVPVVGFVLALVGFTQSRKAALKSKLGIISLIITSLVLLLQISGAYSIYSVVTDNKPRNDGSGYFTFNYKNENSNFKLVPYTDEKFNVSFSIPESWKVATAPNLNENQTFIVPKDDADLDTLGIEAISVSCSNSPRGQNATAEGFYTEAERAFPQAAKDRSPAFDEIRDETSEIINTYPAYHHIAVYDDLVGITAAPGLAKSTTYYHTWYLVNESRICSLYMQAVGYGPGNESSSPLLKRAAEISQSFQSK